MPHDDHGTTGTTGMLRPPARAMISLGGAWLPAVKGWSVPES
ncbi:hypothetical protein [Saccharothrix xinjiangensis]|uniref:Uncharacterized protein n=1 Tax=Saccharothrix xinjiangensis TaxID=204798 RepID=A0ABV9Y224_9PSEU